MAVARPSLFQQAVQFTQNVRVSGAMLHYGELVIRRQMAVNDPSSESGKINAALRKASSPQFACGNRGVYRTLLAVCSRCNSPPTRDLVTMHDRGALQLLLH